MYGLPVGSEVNATRDGLLCWAGPFPGIPMLIVRIQNSSLESGVDHFRSSRTSGRSSSNSTTSTINSTTSTVY